MSSALVGGEQVAKKKTEPKRYGTLIRVSDAFATLVRDAASFEKRSVAGYADAYLTPVVEHRHKAAVVKEARRMEGNG